MTKYKVIDWGDDAYRESGGERVIARFEWDGPLTVCHDGGRLDVDGHPDTIYVTGHQWSIRVDEEGED